MEFIPYGCQDKIRLTAQLVQNLIAVPTRSGRTCSERDAIKFMMLCQAKRLNPFEGDAYLIGYDGKDGPSFSLITAHQAFLKRAELHPSYDGMKSGIIIRNEDGSMTDTEGDFHTEEQTVVGGWATVFFKDRKYPMHKRLRLSRFRKNFGVWLDDPAGMIVKCFDDQTEVLTTRGFERFSCAEGSILQVTEFGLCLTDAIPFVQNHDGDMIAYDSDDLNFCVTPNHDMLTTHGKIEAGAMFEQARMRPKFWIPRTLKNAKGDCPLSDREIQLAAIFITDGSVHHSKRELFRVSVSRARKVQLLDSIGSNVHRYVRACAGDESKAATRIIKTKSNKVEFYFAHSEIARIVNRQKQCEAMALLSMSQRQAKLFVDTMIFCDGTTVKDTGVRRFYASRIEVIQAFELAAVQAGYSVSHRKQRTSDISTKPNICVTISERDAIPVRRLGRELTGRSKMSAESHNNYPSLTKITNLSGKIWCVTVPSGIIVVRRRGFSMLCGNCAEADALRSSFPTMLGGLYLREEIDFPLTSGEKVKEIPGGLVQVVETVSPVSPEHVDKKDEEIKNTKSRTKQDELCDIVNGGGFDFTMLQKWGIETGNIENAGSLSGYSEIPESVCVRLIRAKTGLLAGLAEMRIGKT